MLKNNDLPDIFALFEQSIIYQEQRRYPVWKNYDKGTIIKAIEDKKHYKVIVGTVIAIAFSVRYTIR